MCGSAVQESLRFYLCARCREQVHVCSRCDRGQIYCSEECSEISRRESVRRAGAKYQKTPQGARNHADRQRRHRERNQKVTHQGSDSEEKSADSGDTWLGFRVTERKKPFSTTTPEPYCHFCGQTVTGGFVRTGYLRTSGASP